MGELISRQALLNKFEPWLKVKDYSDGELNMLKAILYEIRFTPPVGTNLAEVGTDCISRQQAIDAMAELQGRASTKAELKGISKAWKRIKQLPPAEPKKETATVSVGISKGGVTMWYECEACGEPVDQGDTFCSGCGRELIHE